MYGSGRRTARQASSRLARSEQVLPRRAAALRDSPIQEQHPTIEGKHEVQAYDVKSDDETIEKITSGYKNDTPILQRGNE